MYHINLTASEKASLELWHRESRNPKKCDRIKAILLRSEGWDLKSIAQALRIHEVTATRYIKDYVKKEKLQAEMTGSESFLSIEQIQELSAHLESNLFHYAHEIAAYIKNTFGVEYSIPGLNKLLHRIGFSYKKPKGRPHKANPELQEDFIATYEELKSSISPEEKILFIDSCHPTQSTKLEYGWIKTGATKEVSTTASKTRINLIGAIELGKVDEAFVQHYEKINSESVSLFFEQLKIIHGSKKLHIILDGAGYHRSEALQAKAKTMDIALHYLPPYSPNLNPIERLWKIMNEKVRNNYYFATAKEFREKILGFFSDTLPRLKKELGNRVNDNFQRLKQA